MVALINLAERCEAAEGADGELDMLIWAALNGVTEITYPAEAQAHSKSGRVEGKDADGKWILLGWIDPGQALRNWSPYGDESAYPNVTASIDAAMTLVPEGWVIGSLEWWPMRSQGAGVTLMETGEQDGWHGFDANIHNRARASGVTPALALCAAALRARASS